MAQTFRHYYSTFVPVDCEYPLIVARGILPSDHLLRDGTRLARQVTPKRTLVTAAVSLLDAGRLSMSRTGFLSYSFRFVLT